MSLLIDNVRLWDGTGAPARTSMAVELRDGLIHWVGEASEWPGPRSRVEVIEGRARTLIPGLIDCHVHYASPGGPNWLDYLADPPAEIILRAVDLAGATLRSGVTSVRDVGAPERVNIPLARAARAGRFPAPHMHAAGNWIAYPGTYLPFARHFRDAAELRQVIREEIEAGADLIKVAPADWHPGQRPEGAPAIPFDSALLAVAVEEARAAGLSIACHAQDRESCRLAARSGVDSIEHGAYLEADDLAEMAARGTFLVPTLSVYDAWRSFARESEDWPAWRVRWGDQMAEATRAAVAGAIKAGVPLALGTDAGGGGVWHGRVAREVELLVECGMEPAAALQAATASGARLMGELAIRGTVEVGKIADLLLLDGNPLDDPAALRLVAAVFQAGRRVA